MLFLRNQSLSTGGAGGIRTLDRALQPYNGLANRRLQPLGHSSVKADMPDTGASRKRQIRGCRNREPFRLLLTTPGIPPAASQVNPRKGNRDIEAADGSRALKCGPNSATLAPGIFAQGRRRGAGRAACHSHLAVTDDRLLRFSKTPPDKISIHAVRRADISRSTGRCR